MARAEAGQVDEATALLERHVERFPRQGRLSGLARAAEATERAQFEERVRGREAAMAAQGGATAAEQASSAVSP